MLLVNTSNSYEKNCLQEQFQMKGNHFQVPLSQTGTLEAIIRSISFQYYQNRTSNLAQKIISYAQKSLNQIVSLSLLREIFSLLNQIEQNFRKYQEYYIDIGKMIGDTQQARSDLISNDISLQELNDHLFDLVNKGEIRMTRNLDSHQLYQQFQQSSKPKSGLNKTQKTQLPYSHHLNPQKYQTLQTLDESQNNTFNFYGVHNKLNLQNPIFNNEYMNQPANEWWKNDKNGSDSSKSISKFVCKGQPLMNQKSIGQLINQQLKYELNREMEFGRNINKHKQAQQFKYKKLMKQKFISAKLKKRKKN